MPDNLQLDIPKNSDPDSRKNLETILKPQIESKFFPDIANSPEALQKIWHAEKLKLENQSLPDLNERLVREIFIKPPERQWIETEQTMETVTRAGPHIAVYKENQNGQRDVWGTSRLKELSQPYQPDNPASYRMYMQDSFVQGLFRSQNCALAGEKMPEDLYQFLLNSIEKLALDKILAVTWSIPEPEKRFDYLMSRIQAVEFNQFLPTRLDGIIPLINRAAKVSKEDLNASFITTIIEHDFIVEIIFQIERFYNQKSLNPKKIIYVVVKNPLFNINTKKHNTTYLLLLDCGMSEESTNYALSRGKNHKVIPIRIRRNSK